MDNEPTINLTGTELLSTLTAAQVDHVSRGLELACGCELFARGGRLWLGVVGTTGAIMMRGTHSVNHVYESAKAIDQAGGT